MQTEIRTLVSRVSITTDGNVLRVRPSGYISIRTLLRSQREAEVFGLAHPDGWWHITEATALAVPNPVNTLLLRRIRRLPNIRGYILLVPSRSAWILARTWRRLIAADAVARNEDEVRALIA